MERQIQPVLSEAEYNKLKFCYATPDLGRNEIEPNVVYWDWAEYDYTYHEEDKVHHERRKRKQIKFLLLPNVISSASWLKATLTARDCHMNKGSRGADGQQYGRKLTLGWIKLRYPGYDNMRTAPTLEQPDLLAAFYPLVRERTASLNRPFPTITNLLPNARCLPCVPMFAIRKLVYQSMRTTSVALRTTAISK